MKTPLVVSASLLGLFTPIFALKQQGEPQPLAASACEADLTGDGTVDGLIHLEDGFEFKIDYSLSKPLLDPDTGDTVAVAAWTYALGGPERVAASGKMLEYIDADSTEPYVMELALVFPEIALGPGWKGTPPRTYEFSIGPKDGKAWGAYPGLVCKVTRLK